MVDDNDDEELNEKNFNFYLLLNWKKEDVKLYKRKPKSKKVGPYHIPIECNIDVAIPDRDMAELSGKIHVSEEKVDEMTLEEL